MHIEITYNFNSGTISCKIDREKLFGFIYDKNFYILNQESITSYGIVDDCFYVFRTDSGKQVSYEAGNLIDMIYRNFL